MTGVPLTKPTTVGSRWEAFIWPQWLPLRARLPLIAQIAGAAALMAAIAMPRWADVPRAPEAPALPPRPAELTPPPPPPRPAHLNLDVRHGFGSIDLSVTVDGERVLDTTLAGSAKRFGVFGKRAEKSFTKTLDVSPGVRIVRVRVRSAADKFDQTRVEQFDLESASVAAIRIAANKSGLSVVASRPPGRSPPPAAAPTPAAAPSPAAAPFPAAASPAAVAPAPQAAQQASVLAELYQALRSILIAIAGFVASTATAFLVQEFMRSRRGLIFAPNAAPSAAAADRGERRRRRRPGKRRRTSDSRAPADLG